MEVAFTRRSARHATTFEIIVQCLDAAQPTTICELQFRVLTKSRGVGVKERSGIAKTFENKFCRWNLCGELGTLLSGVANAEFENGFNG